MDTFGLDDSGQYVCISTGCRTNTCPYTNASYPSCSMHGFDSVMGFIMFSICSGNEFGWGSYIELGDTWYAWRMGRYCDCVVQQRHVVDFG